MAEWHPVVTDEIDVNALYLNFSSHVKLEDMLFKCQVCIVITFRAYAADAIQAI